MANRKDILQVTGKTIAGVIVKNGGPNPACQVFLIFTDNSYIEFYTAHGEILPSFHPGDQSSPVDGIRDYCSDSLSISIEKIDPSLLAKDGGG